MQNLFQIVQEHPLISGYIGFSFLAALISSLKVADETGSVLKALIAFLTALMSMQGLFSGYLKKEQTVPSPNKAPPTVALVLAFLFIGASLLTGCPTLHAAGGNLKESCTYCAKQTLDDFKSQDWGRTAETALSEIDAALRKDWVNAAYILGLYAERYGEEFITCVVAKFRSYYDTVLTVDAGTPPAPRSSSPVSTGVDRGKANADAWLSGKR